ncbi:MAG: VTT domain-containing protein [Spirochaetota bacterium]
MKSKRPSWPAMVGFPVFFLVIIGFAWIYRDGLIAVFRDREAIRTWILGWGWAGFLAFIALQAFQVIIFMVPGEVVQVAGGWVFGLWQGLGLSILGIGLGSIVNFAAGRFLGRPFVVGLFGEGRVVQMEGLAASGKGAAAFFLLFAIPGIPKDVLCYVAGLVRLRFGTFLAVSMIGRLPGMIGSSWMGSAARDGDWTVAIVILVLASLLFFLGLFFRDRIIAFIGQLLHHQSPR